MPLQPPWPLRGLIVAGLMLTFTTTAVQGQTWRTATQIPGVDMRGLNARQQGMVLRILREEDCPCGCKMKLAQCRIDDQTCPVSPKLARQITDAARAGHPSFIIRSSLLSAIMPKELGNAVSIETLKASILATEIRKLEFIEPKNGQRAYKYDFGPMTSDDGQRFRREVPEYEHLLDYPLGLQRTIEEIRKNRPRDYWRPYLKRAESVVRDQLIVLAKARGPNDQRAAAQLHQQSRNGYSILDQGVWDAIKPFGYVPVLYPNTATKGGLEIGLMDISVNPRGATVYYSVESKFRATAKLGLSAIRDTRRNWNELGKVSNPERFQIPAAGKIRLYAVWPNNLEEITLVEVKALDPDKKPVSTRVMIKAF
ncbi:MAG: hypothetical protein H8E37_07985 [Planctomycetes bacterium]|nr:hypothetical protein [Planctomycetota bacterium]